MSIEELRSTRLKKQAESQQTEVFIYDSLSQEFRTQVVYILNQAVGQPNREFNPYVDFADSHRYWVELRIAFCKEKGLISLNGHRNESAAGDCFLYIMSQGVDDVLDMIEFAFRRLPVWQRQNGISRPIAGVIERGNNFKQTGYQFADDAIKELNTRFQQHYLGYEFVKNQIVRKDDEYIHTETTLPAINLLHGAKFVGASQEFLSAQEHYRFGRYKEASVDALKSMESTIKAICDDQKWNYLSGASSSALIKIVFERGLIPSYLDNQLTSLRVLLESGAATIRNKTSAHGQGATVVPLSPHLAAYSLHLAAASIVFLVESFNDLKSKSSD